MNNRFLLVSYALVSAVLYSVLLPLWEGFDEPFHFAYVQQLANWQGLADPRTSRLSREVAASILLAPASHVVKQNLPQVTSYAQYFSWPASKRSEARRRLHRYSSGPAVAALGILELRSAPSALGVHAVGPSGAPSVSRLASTADRDLADHRRDGRVVAPIERRGAALPADSGSVIHTRPLHSSACFPPK